MTFTKPVTAVISPVAATSNVATALTLAGQPIALGALAFGLGWPPVGGGAVTVVGACTVTVTGDCGAGAVTVMGI
ncbi:hypothetical protein [Mycolicibacterium sp. HS_4_1]